MKTFKNQKEMFNWIWENREHVSEISGKPLLPKGHMKWNWQFAHVLGKQAYPSFKLNHENIMLMLPEEHEQQHNFVKFIEREYELKVEYYKRIYNKQF